MAPNGVNGAHRFRCLKEPAGTTNLLLGCFAWVIVKFEMVKFKM